MMISTNYASLFNKENHQVFEQFVSYDTHNANLEHPISEIDFG